MTVATYEREEPVEGREKGWLRVTIAARKLLQHTLEKTTGRMAREYFTKADTFTRKMPLIKTARKVYRLLKKANVIKDLSYKDDYKLRHKLQVKALVTVDDLETYLDTFDKEKTIPNKAEWVKLIFDVEEPLKGWIRSDNRRRARLKEEKKARKRAEKEARKAKKKAEKAEKKLN